MKLAGLIGGLGPESTIDYYRRLIAVWQLVDPGSAPPLLIDNLDVAKGLRLVASDRNGLVEYLAQSVQRLASGGADFVAITANTPHIVFDELVHRSPVPLVSIVETCAEDAQRRSLTRLALLGTRFTMEAEFYPRVFQRYGIDVVVPTEDERTRIHDIYVTQLLVGDFREDSRHAIEAAVERMRAEERIDGVILGGTELPLLLKAETVASLPALDTTALHVNAIIARMRSTGVID